ncbi:MAG: YcxB family protein [Bryobacteraceae bacterium]
MPSAIALLDGTRLGSNEVVIVSLTAAQATIISSVQNDSLIEVSGKLVYRDLLKFQYAQCYRRTWWIVVLMMLVSLAGVLLAAVLALLTSDLEFARRNGTPFLLLLLFWAVIVTTPYWAARRQMKTNIFAFAPIKCIFSSRGIHRTGTHFSSEISYEALWAVRETKRLFLLYLSAAAAIVVPKRFFKDAVQQHDWRILVEQRISPKCITKSSFLGRWL